MAEDQPFLQVDSDWKKQAQEEKRRLAEKAQQEREAQEKARADAAAAAAKPAAPAGEEVAATPEGGGASFAGLVQQMMTQALFYLGEIAYRGGPPMLDLDRARYQHDLLTMIEQKTANNLTDEERQVLDTALHEVRTRFIRVASEYISF